jgi:hypothetical protein
MAITDPFGASVSARALDFFDPRRQWQRRVWNVGLVLSLRELVEAPEQRSDGVVTGQSADHLRDAVSRKMESDRSFADASQLGVLRGLLRNPRGRDKRYSLRAGSVAQRSVRQIANDLDTHYLERWAVALRRGDHPSVEKTARAIGSHLLDSGFHPNFLHEWWLKEAASAPTVALSDVVSAAHTLLTRSDPTFDVLVAFTAVPRAISPPGPLWLDGSAVVGWARTNGNNVPAQRLLGGFVFRGPAKDPEAAVEQASANVDRLVARAAVGTRNRLAPYEYAWVKGSTSRYYLHHSRKVEIRVLDRQRQLYGGHSGDRVESAIQLVAQLERGPLAPAVAGGWSAVETLLFGPGDEGAALAGDRLATIVACAYVRAELTRMADQRSRGRRDTLARRLNGAPSATGRADIMLAALVGGEDMRITNDQSEIAAAARLTALLSDPAETLRDIETAVGESFRRLYRHRNSVMHGGQIEGVALRATVRAVAPLVGAGIDRVVHAWLNEGLDPLELTARAGLRIATAGTPAGRPLPNLLD